MRQAIVTKYHGPTNSKGARISAKAQAGRIYVPWDYALDVFENHKAAAKVFADKYGWNEKERGAPVKFHGGALPDGTGYVFVNECQGGSF